MSLLYMCCCWGGGGGVAEQRMSLVIFLFGPLHPCTYMSSDDCLRLRRLRNNNQVLFKGIQCSIDTVELTLSLACLRGMILPRLEHRN